MAMTYAQLLQLTQDYCENTETSFVNNVPYFVRSAELRIQNSVQLPSLRRTASSATVLGSNTLAAPSDFLAPLELTVLIAATGERQFLLNKDVNFIREAYPINSVFGTPVHYAVTSVDSTTPFATNFLLGPTPDAAYATALAYFAYPTSIVSGSTSWLGENFESVLLYGTLREAYIYMKGEQDLIDRYEKMYQEALMLLKGLGDGKLRRDAYRSGQNRGQIP